MEESLALQVVRSFVAKLNAHLAESVSALMTDDHRCVDAFAVTAQGRDALRHAWHAYFTRVPDYAIVCEQVISEDHTIVIFGTVSGTEYHDESVRDVRRWVVPAVWKAVVRGTQVAEWRVYYGVLPDRCQADADAPPRGDG